MKRLLLLFVALATVACIALFSGMVTATDTSPPPVADAVNLRTGNVDANANTGITEVSEIRKPTETYAVMPTATIGGLLAGHLELRQNNSVLAGSVQFRQDSRMLASGVYFRHGSQAICGSVHFKRPMLTVNVNNHIT